jgi:hypothetical protein
MLPKNTEITVLRFSDLDCTVKEGVVGVFSKITSVGTWVKLRGAFAIRPHE